MVSPLAGPWRLERPYAPHTLPQLTASEKASGGRPLAADVVKVPHHGSRTSSTAPFVEAVHPRWAAISLGAGNRFGFPHEEAVASWRGIGAVILRTDEGAIRFVSDGATVRRLPAERAVEPLALWREGREAGP